MALTAVAAVVLLCAPLGIIGLATVWLAAKGGTDCLAALASPPASPLPTATAVELDQACDGGDGKPASIDDLHHLPKGFSLPTNAQARVVAFALAQLGEPYVFGAAGPDTWDCSGLIMRAWEQVGVYLTHYTGTMIHEGVAVASLQAMQPGDMIFIPGSNSTRARPGHVGMYIGRDTAGRQLLIHAPQTGDVVKITPVSAWAGDIVKIVRPVVR